MTAMSLLYRAIRRTSRTKQPTGQTFPPSYLLPQCSQLSVWIWDFFLLLLFNFPSVFTDCYSGLWFSCLSYGMCEERWVDFMLAVCWVAGCLLVQEKRWMRSIMWREPCRLTLEFVWLEKAVPEQRQFCGCCSLASFPALVSSSSRELREPFFTPLWAGLRFLPFGVLFLSLYI